MRLQTGKKSSRYATLACSRSFDDNMVVLVVGSIRTLVVLTNVNLGRR